MGKGFVNVSGGGGSEEKLTAHLEDKNNPHEVTAEQVGARPDTWMPKLHDVAFLGENPIKTTADDTPSGWASVGSGFAWYSAAGQLNNQPGTWGFVVNYVYGSDVFQIWRSQNAGPTYMRSGNANGWASAWVQVSMDGHTHDDRYYTEGEVNNLLAAKQNASTAITTGNIGSQNVNYATYAAIGNYDQDYGARLRNQALVAADTTPGANGQIFWTYG